MDHAERAREIAGKIGFWARSGREGAFDDACREIEAALAAVERDTAAAKDAEIASLRAARDRLAVECDRWVRSCRDKDTKIAETRAAAAREMREKSAKEADFEVEFIPNPDHYSGQCMQMSARRIAERIRRLPLPGDST